MTWKIKKTNERFTISANEVTDAKTGLTWKRDFDGKAWNGQTPHGEPSTFTWGEAMTYAASKPDGWRLPTIEEFRELYELAETENLSFPGDEWAWSASPNEANTDYAWAVFYSLGCDNMSYKSNRYSVRLVRFQ